MTFGSVNYVAVLVAGVAVWLLGAVWYMVLSKPWLAASGITQEQMHERRGKPGASLPFIFAFVAAIVMAWMLAGLVAHLGAVTIKAGVISGAFCWFGFVLTTMLVNYSFGGRKWMLLLIDAGYWLASLALMGAIIGAFGAK